MPDEPVDYGTWIAINVPPDVRLDAVAGILSDWEWDVAWCYVDPSLDWETARGVELPVPAARPFPPKPKGYPKWSADFQMLDFRHVGGSAENA